MDKVLYNRLKLYGRLTRFKCRRSYFLNSMNSFHSENSFAKNRCRRLENYNRNDFGVGFWEASTEAEPLLMKAVMVLMILHPLTNINVTVTTQLIWLV